MAQTGIAMELHGFGGTDFRSVFAYVDDLIRQGAFSNLKGLIYFTDGYGTFPERKPDFEAAFVLKTGRCRSIGIIYSPNSFFVK